MTHSNLFLFIEQNHQQQQQKQKDISPFNLDSNLNTACFFKRMTAQIFNYLEELTRINPVYHTYLIAFIVIFGLIGNLFILKVFSRKRFTKILQVKSFFRFLAIADSLFLIYIILIYLDVKLEIRVKSTSKIACKLLSYLGYVFGALPSWILTVISFERFVSVAFPISTFNSYLGKKLVQFSIGFVLILYNLVFYSPLLVFNDLISLTPSNTNNSLFICDFIDSNSKHILILIDMINSFLLPGIIMVVLSILALICIKTSKIHSVASLHGLMLERKLRRDKRFAVVSILLNFLFISLNMFRCVCYFLYGENLYNILTYSVNFYLYLNGFTITFYVLFFFNSIFRDEFLIIIKCRKQKF